jgi:hypothetical protein
MRDTAGVLMVTTPETAIYSAKDLRPRVRRESCLWLP